MFPEWIEKECEECKRSCWLLRDAVVCQDCLKLRLQKLVDEQSCGKWISIPKTSGILQEPSIEELQFKDLQFRISSLENEVQLLKERLLKIENVGFKARYEELPTDTEKWGGW